MTVYTDAQAEADLKRWFELSAQIEQLESEKATIKGRLAALDTGKHAFQAGTVSVSQPLRFSPALAEQLLPADVLATISETKPSASLARKVLGTAMIERLSEPGATVVRVS